MFGPVRESSIERHLVQTVMAAGGYSLKIMPVIAGSPDRLVIVPPGRLFLIELKAPNGRMRPVQEVMHARLAALGTPVTVLNSSAAVDAWVAHVLPPAML
jgi:hypothetical protein